MGFAALFFVRLQRGVLFPCLQRGLFPCLQQGLFPCLLPDGSSLQRPCLQRLPDGAPFRQVACLAGACCRARFPRSSAAPPGQQHLCHCGAPASSSSRWLSATVPPSSLPWHSRPFALPRRPCQQYLPDSSLPQCRHPLCHGTPGHPLCLGAPASNIFQMAFRHGALASSIFPIALCHSAGILFSMALSASSSATAPRPAALPWSSGQQHLPDSSSLQRPCQQHLPDGSSLQRPCQQQTSSGGEEYSGLASNLAHLGRIC